MEEELAFAGHPVLGAAAVMHALLTDAAEEEELNHARRAVPEAAQPARRWPVRSRAHQGPARIGRRADPAERGAFAAALGLHAEDVHPSLPVEMVTTGLPYLIVPVATGLDRAQILVGNFERHLEALDAKFVYVLDVANREGRTWDNDGRVEDVATGSAAGPAAAYLVAHGAAAARRFFLRQGRFAGRPWRLRVTVTPEGVLVGGAVSRVADGTYRLGWS